MLNIDFTGWQGLLLYLGILLVACMVAWGLTRLNHRIFHNIQKKKKNLRLSFFEHVTSIFIVLAVLILTLSAVDGTSSVWQTLLGGTAIVSAVLAFAAQDVIKDVLAGLMISLNHPFEIGQYIELEDGTCGIVEEMTLRHVVLREIDTIRKIIPNSKINAMLLTNYSYNSPQRSIHFSFPIGFGADVELAKKVIYDAVESAECTAPERLPDGTGSYHPVHFIRFSDSALILAVTVYFDRGVHPEEVRDRVNTNVRAALRENGIEIPYNHITVVNAGENDLEYATRK